MNIDVLVGELQANYFIVREAVEKMVFDTPDDRRSFLDQGFRTCWGSAWQAAGRDARRASTSPSSGSRASYTMTTPTTASGVICTNDGNPPKLPELPDASASGAGAAAFLAVLLRTRALTDSQYKALCKELAIQYPARPQEQDVMSLGHDAVVRVLCGGR